MTSGTVLVYGATGTQGQPVAEQLLRDGCSVRVVTRAAERATALAELGADVAVADLGDPDSLASAHAGVDRVVLHLPLQYDFELHETYARNAVAAAREAGVSLLVFNTSAHVLDDPDVTIYRVRQEVVDHLRSSGVPNIVLRPTFYMDNLLGPWIRTALVEDGVLAFPLPPTLPMSWVSAEEAAAYAVAALDRPDLAGSTFDVGGPEPLTGTEAAASLATAIGRPVTYVPLDPDAYEQALVPLFGAAVAYEVAQQIRCISARGDGSVDMSSLRKELGVPALPLQRWAADQSWV